MLAYVAMLPLVTGLLFVFKDGSFLTRGRLDTVQSALRQAGSGMDVSRYIGHNFHFGTATFAMQIGIQDTTKRC